MADDSKSAPIAQVHFEPIVVRYDGLDAEEHRIDLLDFSKSGEGIAKIISTVATFAHTGNYVSDNRSLECRTTIGVAEENCYSFTAFVELINGIDGSPFATATLSGIFLIAFQYVWNKVSGRNEEMRHLHDALIKSIEQLGRKDDQARLLDTIDKMATALIPAAKKVVRPIGRSCETIRFGNENKEYFTRLDIDDKSAISGEEPEITAEETFKVIISELDMRRGTCKVSFLDNLDMRYNARISDPQIELADNPYSVSMSKKDLITIRAKQKIKPSGSREFIISDVVIKKSAQMDLYEPQGSDS